jgi:hypothetical protein
MTVEQQPGTVDTVRLTYRPTREQIAEVMRTRRRVNRSTRRSRVVLVVAVAILVIVVVLAAVNGEGLATAVPILLLGAVTWALMLLPRRFMVRQVHKLRESRGEHTVMVGADGVRVATDLNTARVPWSLSGYAETEHLFVLLHRGMNDINTTPLPKVALPERDDVDRLRDLLDRHSVRTASAPRA